jgi:hypothetical protein
MRKANAGETANHLRPPVAFPSAQVAKMADAPRLIEI